MEKLIQIAGIASIALITGCSHLTVKTTLDKEGNISGVDIDRWAFMWGAEWESIDIPNIGTIKGYKADGGAQAIGEMGILAGTIAEKAAKGAVEGAK